MPTNRKVQRAVRLALGLGAGTLTFGVSPGVLAQVEGNQVLEEVIVTGSRVSNLWCDLTWTVQARFRSSTAKPFWHTALPM